MTGINWWTELISVLLRKKKPNDQSTAYACIKIAILSECIGMYDYMIIIIALYSITFGKAGRKFSSMIPEILAAVVGASRGQSIVDEANQ